MRKLAIVLALFGFAFPVSASKGISVAELERRLASERGKADAEVAQDLSEFELTERLSTTTLTQLKLNAAGSKTAQELKILADQSEFLSLPAAEIPATATPDLVAQRKMMGMVVNYVSKSIHQLPNFYATRVTTHFEETPQIQTGTNSIAYQPLHETNASNVTVLYRNGQEVVDTGMEKAKAADHQETGLQDWGVFGPILSTVFLDAAKSNLSWSHWEQGPTGTRAVFRYSVPLGNSHYRANYCCVPNQATDSMKPFDRIVGYRGEIAVDPQEGSILRLTVQADLKPSDPISKADIMVEYGRVEVGGQSYVCATRSVALSVALSTNYSYGDVGAGIVSPSWPQKLLNDVAFEQYHMFRSDARIVAGDEAKGQGEPPTAISASETPSQAAKAPPVGQPTESTEQQSSTREAESPGAATQEHRAEQGATAAYSPTPQRAPNGEAKSPATDHAPLFKTATHEVLVEVVATKSKGEPILGLGRQDFEIKEDGKPQTIDFFEAHTERTVAPSGNPEMPVMPVGTRTNVPPAPPSDAIDVLLIDTLNTEMQDQAYLRQQVMAFFTKMQPGTRMAIFVLGAKLTCLQGFTTDSSALLAALKRQPGDAKTQKSSLLQTRSDSAGDADALSMLLVMQASPAAVESMRNALAAAVGQGGGARASMTFEALMYLGHYLAGVSGRKNLIWFSGSFPIVIFPSAAQFDRIQQNTSQRGYLDRVRATADLYTTSQIAVYPISAEGMMVEHIGEAESAGHGGAMGSGHGGSGAGSTLDPYHEGANARADMISGMEQLAASTGGKAYFNTNDLNSALHHAVDDGANYYTIGYSPAELEADGSYRQIEIKLAHGKSNLSYRQGYIADYGPAPTPQSSPAQSGIDPLTPLLQFGLPAATAILYGVQAEPSADQPTSAAARPGQNPKLKGPLTRYTVSFVVRGQDLVLNPNPEGARIGKFLLGLKAYDRDGNALNWAANEETVEIKPEQFDLMRKNGIPAHLNIDLPTDADIHLVTAVYDLDGGMAGTLEIPMRVTSQTEVDRSAPSETQQP